MEVKARLYVSIRTLSGIAEYHIIRWYVRQLHPRVGQLGVITLCSSLFSASSLIAVNLPLLRNAFVPVFYDEMTLIVRSWNISQVLSSQIQHVPEFSELHLASFSCE